MNRPCNRGHIYDPRRHRPKTLELLQRPSRRRNELRRLRRTAHLSALPQDGRRAHPSALQPEERRAGKVRLADPGEEGRRRPLRPLPPYPGKPRQRKGAARPDLRQVAEQIPGPGQAAPADRRSDRQGKLVGHERRREGGRLRGAAGEERPGHQVRRRAVLHPPAADPGHGRRRRPQARREDLRPGLRHRRLSPRRPRLHRQAPSAPDQATSARRSRTRPSRGASWCRARRGCAP